VKIIRALFAAGPGPVLRGAFTFDAVGAGRRRIISQDAIRMRVHSRKALAMYAVIKTGGKQYKVAKNDVIVIEKLDAETGKTVEFTDVLMVGGEGSATVGKPMVAGAVVRGTVLDQRKGEKIVVFKKRRRKNSRRKNGHRQFETVVRISDIQAA